MTLARQPQTITDLAIKAVKPGGARRRLSDGRGLYLLLFVNGGSHGWRLDYTHEGRRKTLSLGTYPDTSIKLARSKAEAARQAVAAGVDPSDQRKAFKAARQAEADNADRAERGLAPVGSFEETALAWWSQWSKARTVRHAGYVLRRLQADVFPAIGHAPVDAITAPQLVGMVKAIEARGALDLAKRAMQTAAQVFRYAIAHGLAQRNPATDIRPSDVLPSRRKHNYARLPAKEVPELLRKIEAYQGTPITRLALKLMALTFVRTSELIGARWPEFDLDQAEWRIPPERMKMRDPHIVPLSPQAVEVLRTLHTVTGTGDLLLPGERDHARPMSNNTILAALKRMGYAGRMTGHGFRGIASTILHEQGYPHHVIELQLAHQERDEVSAAYNHATYLAERRKMMAEWAAHLDALRQGNVIKLPQRAA